MDKPLTVERAEFMEAIVKIINESKLPAFIIADVLSQALSAVENHAEAEYQNDLRKYNNSLKEEK